MCIRDSAYPGLDRPDSLLNQLAICDSDLIDRQLNNVLSLAICNAIPLTGRTASEDNICSKTVLNYISGDSPLIFGYYPSGVVQDRNCGHTEAIWWLVFHRRFQSTQKKNDSETCR